MAIALSKRSADQKRILDSVERDQVFKRFFSGQIDQDRVQEAVQYLVNHYQMSETDSEGIIRHFLRSLQQRRAGMLSNRKAQVQTPKEINIPPTTDNPIGRKVPLKTPPDNLPPTPEAKAKVSINPQPADTPAEKSEDVQKAVEPTEQTNRQQKLVDCVRGCKVMIQELADSMYGVQLPEELLGKGMSKMIENVSDLCAEATSSTVKTLVSPLIGGG